MTIHECELRDKGIRVLTDVDIDTVAGGSVVPQFDEFGQPLIPGTFHNGKYVPNLL